MIRILLIVIFCFVFLDNNSLYSNELYYKFHFSSDKYLQIGEELDYIVRYSFINLGEVKIRVKDRKEVNGRYYYNTIAYIDSYNGIPFVNLHQIYESKVNQNYYSDFFRGIVKGDELTSYTEYYFNYDNSQIRIKKGRFSPQQLWVDSTTTVGQQYHDGLSIFFYARMFSGKKNSITLPCFVNEQKVKTKINFYPEIIPVSIDNIDYEVECVRLDGEMDFISIFGLTGYFEGWFTNDEASIPIVANMKVLIGNITLELKSWKRAGWNPPKYKN
ncbi:MAG: DUF3108 domain-containing protein [Ignavibacteriaceae bacterium]|nr:DUF3108 domain-containing protein [Ignavibacteriaceae bacterium]